uniref:DMRT like family A2 n=2 Tax=Anas platyrhynchos TaxID=8839 RepID=A0A8B9TUC1_ANAPL
MCAKCTLIAERQRVMAAQVALRRQQAQEENEARELQLLYGTAEGLALAAANGIIPPRPAYEVFGSVCAGAGGEGGAGASDAKVQKFELFPKTLLPSRAVTPQQAAGKPLSPDGEAAPGTSSPEARHGSGSENGDGESFLSSPVSKGPKEGEESPGSISPLGSDSGSEADKDEQDPSPSAGGRQRTPIDILTRVFPAHKRSVLELVLQGCGGDVVQAIEQILNNRGPDKGPEEGWAREGALQGLPPAPAAAAHHHRPLIAGAMAPAIGTLGSRSAFSPLQPNATHFGAEASAYPLGTHLGLNPLRLAYSAHSRGLAFMTPYSTAGLMPTLGFRPPVDYAFSDLMRDRSAVHKEQVYSGGLYGPMVNNTPEKQ